MFKLKCLQGSGLKEDYTFKSKAEVIENLSNFHNMDYEGMKDDGTRYKDIYEFLSKFSNEDSKLEWLLDYGDWELITV